MNQATATTGLRVFNVTATDPAFAVFNQNFSFASDTTANLTFQDLGLGADNFGVGIDRVLLTQVVPEPTSCLLLAVGGALLCALPALRRRSKL